MSVKFVIRYIEIGEMELPFEIVYENQFLFFNVIDLIPNTFLNILIYLAVMGLSCGIWDLVP